jgi:hypothetical protein
LIALAALPLRADDISLAKVVTQDEFSRFSRIVGQGIFATPVSPARATGFLGFDVGVAATLVNIDHNASYWQHAVPAGSSLLRGSYLAVPRLVASKGLGFATISGTWAKVTNSSLMTWGGAVDVPIIRGTVATPELALRGSYSTLTGSSSFGEKTYGAELFVSKGFGPFMPYGAVGKMRTSAHGTIPGTTTTLRDTSNLTRFTAGVRVSLLVPKLVVEATQAEVRSYAARISIGF